MANISAETSTQAVPHEQVVIIGAGAAGLTAGIYTARANLESGHYCRLAARWSDDDHHGCGELSGFCQCHPGAMADDRDAVTG